MVEHEDEGSRSLGCIIVCILEAVSVLRATTPAPVAGRCSDLRKWKCHLPRACDGGEGLPLNHRGALRNK